MFRRQNHLFNLNPGASLDLCHKYLFPSGSELYAARISALAHQRSRYRQVNHTLQTRGGSHNMRNHVNGDTHGCLAAGDFRFDCHVNFWQAVDINIIASILVFEMRMNLLG